jgi:hypothetical protein
MFNLNKVLKLSEEEFSLFPDPDMYLSSRAIVVYIYVAEMQTKL